jgi:hypothetical protein
VRTVNLGQWAGVCECGHDRIDRPGLRLDIQPALVQVHDAAADRERPDPADAHLGDLETELGLGDRAEFDQHVDLLALR